MVSCQKGGVKDHVTFGNFVRHFNLADQQSATDAYVLLLQSDEISRDRRRRLQQTYEDFIDHHAKRFWAERSLRISSEVTAKQAAIVSQEVGLKQSEIGYSRHFSNIGGKPFFNLQDNVLERLGA